MTNDESFNKLYDKHDDFDFHIDLLPSSLNFVAGSPIFVLLPSLDFVVIYMLVPESLIFVLLTIHVPECAAYGV